MQKLEQKTITGTIILRSGMRIGGSDDLLQIGGVDLTSIKHPVTRKPYIPGSSFKGKMRSELEKKLGKINGNEPCGCARQDCLVCRVFGPHKKANHDLGPSRLIVRDAELVVGGELENKTENIIDRKVGTARHPRTVERVAANSEFDFKIGIQIWDLDKDCQHNGKTSAEALVEFVKDGLRQVQETGLGSGVSKGYGEIEFVDLKLDGVDFTL
jgi:CRISPR-associated protein Csm3